MRLLASVTREAIAQLQAAQCDEVVLLPLVSAVFLERLRAASLKRGVAAIVFRDDIPVHNVGPF